MRECIGPVHFAKVLQSEIQRKCRHKGIILYLLPTHQGDNLGLHIQADHFVVNSVFLQRWAKAETSDYEALASRAVQQ